MKKRNNEYNMSTLNQPKEERRTYRHKGGVYLLNDEKKTAWIVRGPRIGRRRRFRVPETIDVEGNAYAVESIEINAFDRAKCLKHLVIPDSIEFIDEYNFSHLPSLRSIYIGKGLSHLTSWTFDVNRKLRSFVIAKENPHFFVENGVVYTADGKRAVTTPFCLNHVSIKEGVKAIGPCCLWWNHRLQTITFPSTLKSIGDNSIAGCPKLKELVLPEGVEECITQSFLFCGGLERVELPSTLTEIDHESFCGCDNLRILIIRKDQLLVPTTINGAPIYLPKGCTLKVPKNLVAEYRAHPLWAKASNVEEIES